MQAELYADAIGEITVSGPIVRIDLVSLSATARDAAGQPVPEFRQRVIMSIDGFANSFEVIQKAFNGLLEAGAIKRTGLRDDARAPQAVGLVRPNGSALPLNGSPNFV